MRRWISSGRLRRGDAAMSAEAEELGVEDFCILTLTIKLGKGNWVRVAEWAWDG